MSATPPPSAPNYGTCENHPHHTCRCTDEDRQRARDIDAAVAAQPSSESVNEWLLTPAQQATFDATDCTCEHAPRHSTACAKWAVLAAQSIVPLTPSAPSSEAVRDA